MSASPSYGERPPLQSTFRRSFTTPTRQLSFHEKAGLEQADAGADILYSHPSVRIISFSPPKESIKSTSKADIPADTDYPVDTIETLPWRSRTETLAASGVMVLEKVRGSTNFLKCQSITHAILRNSQCWCVDGQSKFVLRVRKFQYYRIELPSTTEEDTAKVEELKRVFPTLLKYERTPCPFIRAFTVDLPDDAITPRRKGQWKRRDSSQPSTPDNDTPSLRKSGPSRSWSMRSPPTSYPKRGPGASLESFENDRGRTTSPSSVLRQASLFENSRDSSPAGFIPSDEGTDSEQQPSEHDSELDDTPDRSETDSPQIQLNHRGTPSPPNLLSVVKRPLKDLANNYEAREEITNTTTVLNRYQEPKKDDALSNNTVSDTIMKDGPESSSSQELAIQSDPSLVTRNQAATRQNSVLGTLNIGNRDDSPPPEQQNEKLPKTSEPNVELAEAKLAPTVSHPNFQTVTVVADESQQLSVEKPVGTAASIEISSTTKPHEAMGRSIDISLPSKHDSGSDSSQEEPNLEIGAGTVASTELPAAVHSREKQHLSSTETSSPAPIPSKLITKSSDEQDKQDENEEGRLEEDILKVDGQPNEASTEFEEVNISMKHYDESLEPGLVRPSSDQGNARGVGQDQAEESDDDSKSTTSSVDSFHTLASPLDDSPTTNRFDQFQSLNIGRPALGPNANTRHKRDWSEVTVTASSTSDSVSLTRDNLPDTSNDQPQPQLPTQTPILDSSQLDNITSIVASSDQEGLRQRAKNQRSFSPLPPASTIFTGHQIRHGTGSGHMTKVILQKIIVKPLEVAIMVVHILTRIAGGATVSDLLSGELFKRPEHQRSLSGFANQEHRSGGTSDTDDDYGVPIRGRQRHGDNLASTATSRKTSAVSAEID